MASHPPRRLLAGALATLMATAGLVYLAPAASADQTIGYPTFSGPDIPAEPVEFTVDGTMQAMYEAEAADDGTDFWMDRLLARPGNDPAGNQWLLTRGRALFMRTHQPNVLGFAGTAAYWDSLGGDMYTISLGEGFSQVTAERVQYPSHWSGVFTNNAAGLHVDVKKFITHNNVAVTNLAITNSSSETRTVPITAESPFATTPAGAELTDIVDAHRGLTQISTRLSGDHLERAGRQLVGELPVEPGETVETKVTMGFTTEEIPESVTEYEAYRDAAPHDAFVTHVQEYNRWWAENLPYFDVPDDEIKKWIYYRWWLMRFNFLDADIPGNDFQFPTAIEGVLGYNNVIALTVPMFVDELKYLRDPVYALGTWLSSGETSADGRYSDNPAEPNNWNDAYLQYTTDAAWRAYQIHGGQPDILERLAHYGEQDVKDQLAFHNVGGYNPTNPNNNPWLLWYCCNYLNGNDADNTSFNYPGLSGGNERVESAYVYANATAAADAYELIGEQDKADEMRDIAADVRDAILNVLWHDDDRLFYHRNVQNDALIPRMEINNYYPFTVGLVPNEQPYLDALRLYDDPDHYPIFPFYTANQVHKAESGGSNNFSQINSTVQFRLVSSLFRDYDAGEGMETDVAEWYKKLFYWNAWAHYIGGDTQWPDANEFWFNWNADTETINGRSGIHHTLLGSAVWTVVEDVMGLRPRLDNKVELWPIDVDWDHFVVNDLNYRGNDLTIVWDDPADGTARYPGVPEGYSVFVDGERKFTVDGLVHTIWDPDTGAVEFPNGDGTVLFNEPDAGLPAPDEVALDGERVVDIFAKAGVDLTGTGSADNLAPDATPSASHVDNAAATNAYGPTSLDAAVDGLTTNLPFWGSAGSGDEQDWYELDFGEPTSFDDVRLYFFNDREVLGVPNQHRAITATDRYREPAVYTVQVFADGEWVDVEGQANSPAYPRSNYNHVRFPEVTAERMRVLMTHRPGYGTGLKEIQVFRTGLAAPPAENQPPQVIVRTDPTFSAPSLVRLEGRVKDDGLPGGVVEDLTWSLVDGPGTALFATPSELTTLASFSEPGEYVVELSASDGELTGAAQLTVIAEDAGELNVAPLGTPECSYTSPWESCAAIVNGSTTSPTGSQQVWGTWPEGGNQWVQVAWDEPVRVNGASIWWLQDSPPPGGLQPPGAWNLQYWDGDQFVDVPGPGTYGTAPNQFNPVDFDGVTTTILRANLFPRSGQGGSEGYGMQEFEIYAEDPESVQPVEVTTELGQLPDLPQTVTLVYADGSTLEAGVTWQEVTPDQVAQPGTFQVAGIVAAASMLAIATVEVVGEPDQTATTVVTQPNPSQPGQEVTATATVTALDGVPAGAVEFAVEGDPVGGPVPLEDGRASVTLPELEVGAHVVSAAYSPTDDHRPSAGETTHRVVVPAPTTTEVVTEPNPSAFGQGVTAHIAVTGTDDTPTGEVELLVGGIPVGGDGTFWPLDDTGEASVTIPADMLPIGEHVVRALYLGDDLHEPSDGQVDQVVEGASSTTTVTTDPNPVPEGEEATATALVSPASATGTVQFSVDGEPLGDPVALDGGQATVTLPDLEIGGYVVGAAYGGDANHQASAGQTIHAVQPSETESGNPIVRDIFTADPAALTHDGRMYIFSGRDEASPTQSNFVMNEWHAFSSGTPTNDPDAWEHHGALLSVDDFEWASGNAWAAEVVQGPDGRFYWFVSLLWADAPPGNDAMAIGVAVAEDPLGPYEDPIGAPLVTSTMPNASAHNIDPTVIVDDEHGIYMYWGSFWSPRFVELEESMTELAGPITTPQGLSEFWEAPWIFERDGVYYNAYSSNANIAGDGCVTSSSWACIRYATADHPAGPWTHEGIVLGQVSSTTNHPATVEFPAGSDEWWMVYHTADLPDGGTFRRSVAIDRLYFNPDGSMQEVVQTRFTPPEPEPEPTDNAALSAAVTCSFTSPWESCDALNSGDDPASSNIPGANLGTRWGTWPEGGEHWIQYAWDEPVRVDSTDMYWFQDVPDGTNGGVKRAAEWFIEYRDGEDWVDLANASGYGTALDQYNRTDFDPVTTTQLRATVQTRGDADGVGALQWKAYSAEPESVDPVEVTTQVGVAPELPETVTLRYEDGASLEAGVWWRPFDEELLNDPGTFTVGGVIRNQLVEAEATVHVEEPDACPDGYSPDQTVVFGDRDSGVPNYDRGDGCTFLDLVWDQAPFADHGGLVSVVDGLAHAWEAEGRLTEREKSAIIVAAAQSSPAWREGPPDPG